MVKLLLNQDGVNPDSKDRFSRTPLSRAAEKGHEAVIKLLLAQDDVDPLTPRMKTVGRRWGGRPRRSAWRWSGCCSPGDGVNPDSEDKYRRTPLSWAAEKGQGEPALPIQHARMDSSSTNNI